MAMLPVTIAKCRQQLPVDLIPMWVNAAAPCASGVMLFVSHSALKLKKKIKTYIKIYI